MLVPISKNYKDKNEIHSLGVTFCVVTEPAYFPDCRADLYCRLHDYSSYWPLLMVIISFDRMVDEIYQNNVQPLKSGLGSLGWARFWSGLELK